MPPSLGGYNNLTKHLDALPCLPLPYPELTVGKLVAQEKNKKRLTSGQPFVDAEDESLLNGHTPNAGIQPHLQIITRGGKIGGGVNLA